MKERGYSFNSYRYGFNGMEKDDEAKGQGNSYDFGERIYDPRIGKFLSVDPIFKKYPELTPYQFASNRPIDGIDLDGLEHVTYTYARMPNGQAPTLIGVTKHIENGPKGHGIAIKIIDAKGQVTPGFVSTNEAPKPKGAIQDVLDGPDGGVPALNFIKSGNSSNSMEGASVDGTSMGAEDWQAAGKVGLGMLGGPAGLILGINSGSEAGVSQSTGDNTGNSSVLSIGINAVTGQDANSNVGKNTVSAANLLNAGKDVVETFVKSATTSVVKAVVNIYTSGVDAANTVIDAKENNSPKK